MTLEETSIQKLKRNRPGGTRRSEGQRCYRTTEEDQRTEETILRSQMQREQIRKRLTSESDV